MFSRKTLGFLFRGVLFEGHCGKGIMAYPAGLAISAEDFGAARITQIKNSLCLIFSTTGILKL